MNIVLPSLGDIDEVEVTEICVAVGDDVGSEDPIIVIESDKASMEVPAGGAGTVVELHIAVGDRLVEGAVIGVLTALASAQGHAEIVEPPPEKTPAAPSSVEPSDVIEQVVAPIFEPQTVQILVPDLGDIEQVEVIEVAAKAGAEVTPGDLLVVLESDKASMEIPAEVTGRLLEVSVAVGDQVVAGSLLALAEISGAQADTKSETNASAGESEMPLVPAPAAPSTIAPKPEVSADLPSGPSPAGRRQVYAGPATRRLAREIGVILEQVAGSGKRGRVTKDDVKAWAKARLNQPAAAPALSGEGIPPLPVVDFSKFGDIEEIPLSRIQKQVAVNMHRSWVNIPHVTQHAQADIDDLEAFRQSLKVEAQGRGVKLSPLPFIIKAVCHTLSEHAKLNGSVSADGEHLVLKHFINIGIAVDTPDGLVVPVIRGADQLGIWALAEQAQTLADKARNKKLALDDLSGGTFTISSLGALGGTGFTPIINAPEVGILGIGQAALQPIWQGEGFAPRLQLPLSLSYDHRVINGTDGGRFVVTLTQMLADIRRLVL